MKCWPSPRNCGQKLAAIVRSSPGHRAARRRDPRQAARSCAEQDHVSRHSTWRHRSCCTFAGDDLGEPARNTNLLQAVGGEEPDPLAVGRPEGRVRAFGARHGLCRRLRIQRAKPQLFRSARLGAHVDDVAAVRGQRKRRTVAGIERRAWRRGTACSESAVCPGAGAAGRTSARPRPQNAPTMRCDERAIHSARSTRRESARAPAVTRAARADEAIERNSNSRSFAVCHRSSGSLARHLESVALSEARRLGTRSTIGGGSSFRIAPTSRAPGSRPETRVVP